METLMFKEKTYQVDDNGFLMDPNQWDEDFAVGLAPNVGILQGLTEEHWEIIRFIRETSAQEGKCPLVFQTCRAKNLCLRDLRRLFPTGYLRGACKLAGITYKEGWSFPGLVPMGDQPAGQSLAEQRRAASFLSKKTYTIDAWGFLVNPDEWDKHYVLLKAEEMGLVEALTGRHWEIIYFMRDSFKKKGVVPTVYETCEAKNLEIEDLERLFPHGYHRGAVKMAGLRVR